MKRLKISSSTFLMVILVSLAVSPAFALGVDGRNLFLIGVMLLSPILLISYKTMYKSDVLLVLFMFSLVLSPFANHPESMRWSTVLYTLMFAFTFMVYKQLLHVSSLSIKNYETILKYLIYAYFATLLIQQFCVLTGLPIFNLSNYDPGEPWKLNTLTSEPSHSARIVGLLMFCYISAKELVVNRKYNFDLDLKDDKWIWVAFIWTMLTMGSGTAFLFIAIVLLKFIKFKTLIPLFIIFGIIILIVNLMGITGFERTFKIFMATLTFDKAAIIEADHSAAFRIVPMLILIERVDIITIDGWFGHGIDNVASWLSLYMPGLPDGYSGGGLLLLWNDSGFLTFILFILFTLFNSIKKGDYLSIAFWFLLVFIQGINSQIVWLCLVLLLTNKYFQNISLEYNKGLK